MEVYSTDFILVTFISISLLFLRCEAHAASTPFQATVYVNNNTLVCHSGLMSVYISKVQFAGLPFSIYVQDERSGYYQAVTVAEQCGYFLRETEIFIILTVPSHGCFVRRQKYITNLTVVIMALADRGRVEIVQTIPVICERTIKEANKNVNPLSEHFFCNKNGFNITIPQSATVPPLNLDSVWIPSRESRNCKPQKTSRDSITFIFPFTDCGTQSMTVDGIITYWVKIEMKQHPQKGFISHDTPFHLTVHCSFALAQSIQLGIEVQEVKSESPSTLKSEGILTTAMRFAKDSSYTSFYSSRDPPAVTELGQPVYVEVFLLKHEDKDLVLLLDDCWATPTKNPHDPQRWNLLVKGCPFTGDSHRTVLLPVVSSEGAEVSLASEVVCGQAVLICEAPTSDNLVYFHCDIEICKGPGCLQSCSNGRRKFRRITPGLGQRIHYSVVSSGPLLYLL